MIPYDMDTATTAMPTGSYKLVTSYGYVYVQSTYADTTNISSTDSSTTGFSFNIPRRNDNLIHVELPMAEEPPPPQVYPLRVSPLKLCPCRTTPLSRPMAECYWQRGPPHLTIIFTFA